MKKFLFPVILTACVSMFFACGEQPAATEDIVPSLTIDQLETPTLLTVKIEGMACPAGCAKPIANGCAKLAGMAESRVDFAEGTGYFTYDASKLTEQDIIKCIEATNGGDHYKVTETQVKALSAKEGSEATDEEAVHEST
jgi:copper chaperone CopZ